MVRDYKIVNLDADRGKKVGLLMSCVELTKMRVQFLRIQRHEIM